ncbi:non-ribosomal peptide synthetase [Mucilaginibacter gotjawali]|uniref:Amino acid adenylation domain-containing protein n=1 Tax=Mucilaginibacter gotjawali TaxID=1550579 RepID=A0A839S939_9SPHI|nr:amino acid adenylation domain-containing protein [Mucilaginibacter gotjawali]MBB3054651.1 amino acid adenylation domain-containing protein [Mucilaginibacter gotjawali]
MTISKTDKVEPKTSFWSEKFENVKDYQLLKEFNNTVVFYPREKTLTDLFEEQVLRTPQAIALRRNDQIMRYDELNKKANQLAHYLITHGVQSGDNVGLLVSRNFDMIVGMLAILKAGGAYVPIDPEYPLDRQQYILKNSEVSLVITDCKYPLSASLDESQLVKLREINTDQFKNEKPAIKADSKQLAYTIYTSGSTGMPKGVMIEHHSAVNLVLWVNREFNVGPDDCLLFVTSMCFDLSVYDIFGLLAAGGSLLIIEKQELMDVPKLKELMTKHRVTFWDSVPSTIDYFIGVQETVESPRFENALRLVFMSGDWIPVGLPDRIKKYFPAAKTISLGGATEGTVWSNFYPIDKTEAHWASIPYGRPMSNNFYYILDEQLNPVPVGEVGELYIGGVGVARGYAQDTEKTGKAFLKDPFTDQMGGRMYKTGDMGRMMPDLNMEFLGRIDDQVKIRGFRIELGEINAFLQKHEKVKTAVVLAKPVKDREKELVAYVVGDAGPAELRSFLNSQLPDYMVPGSFVKIDSIPLTSNGKVDKKALLLYAGPETDEVSFYIAPRTNIEKLVADIWAEALNLEKVGIYDNFFQIGGHSLIAVKVMTMIEQKTGKRLPLATLFEHQTVERTAQLISRDGVSITWDSLVPIKPHGHKTPLYLVHGAGLNVLLFNAVATGLSPDQPVYGLQAKGLNGIDEPLKTIEEIAAHYVNAITRQNPDGPYALGGFSMGGVIAFEMTRQIKALGKEVSMLALFDAYIEKCTYYDPLLLKIAKNTGFYIKSLLYIFKFSAGFKSTLAEKTTLFKRRMMGRYWSLRHGKGHNKQGFFGYAHKIDKYNTEALNRYRFYPLDIEVDAFKAETRTFYAEDSVYMGWKPYALKGVNIHLIPGEHNTIFKAPNDIEFAQVLQQCLDRIENKNDLSQKIAVAKAVTEVEPA